MRFVVRCAALLLAALVIGCAGGSCEQCLSSTSGGATSAGFFPDAAGLQLSADGKTAWTAVGWSIDLYAPNGCSGSHASAGSFHRVALDSDDARTFDLPGVPRYGFAIAGSADAVILVGSVYSVYGQPVPSPRPDYFELDTNAPGVVATSSLDAVPTDAVGVAGTVVMSAFPLLFVHRAGLPDAELVVPSAGAGSGALAVAGSRLFVAASGGIAEIDPNAAATVAFHPACTARALAPDGPNLVLACPGGVLALLDPATDAFAIVGTDGVLAMQGSDTSPRALLATATGTQLVDGSGAPVGAPATSSYLGAAVFDDDVQIVWARIGAELVGLRYDGSLVAARPTAFAPLARVPGGGPVVGLRIDGSAHLETIDPTTGAVLRSRVLTPPSSLFRWY